MKARVRLFAALREAVGAREVTLDLREGASVRQAFEQLCSAYPALARYGGQVAFAVNAAYVPPEHPLRGGDELAVIPPVSGGAPALIRVTTEPLDPPALTKTVRTDADGAVCLFLGVVRSHNAGRAVQHLEYEAYPEMAETVLREIVAEAQRRWPIGAVAAHHRIGWLELGEASLAVAVAAPHRRESFEACQWIVEELKARVPVWKKEVGPEGEVWVEGHRVAPPEPVEPAG